MKVLRPSRNEAAIFQRQHGHRDILVELSGWGLFDPWNARWLDARAFASLKEAPGWARFEPDTLATPAGLLRLSETSLYIDRLLIATRDDRAMSAEAHLRFSLKRDAENIARQVSLDILRLLPCELSARVAAAVRAEVSALHYSALQAEFREIEQRVLQRLRAELCQSPETGNGQLGLVLSSLTIDMFEDHLSRADAPHNLASFIAQTAGAIEAIQGTATMSEIAPIVVAQYSLEQTKAVAKAPNGFMIAPQHLGGFDPNAGPYSPLMNPAINYLHRSRDEDAAVTPPLIEASGDDTPLPANQRRRADRLKGSLLRQAPKPPVKRSRRDFDPDRQRFSGPF